MVAGQSGSAARAMEDLAELSQMDVVGCLCETADVYAVLSPRTSVEQGMDDFPECILPSFSWSNIDATPSTLAASPSDHSTVSLPASARDRCDSPSPGVDMAPPSTADQPPPSTIRSATVRPPGVCAVSVCACG